MQYSTPQFPLYECPSGNVVMRREGCRRLKLHIDIFFCMVHSILKCCLSGCIPTISQCFGSGIALAEVYARKLSDEVRFIDFRRARKSDVNRHDSRNNLVWFDNIMRLNLRSEDDCTLAST